MTAESFDPAFERLVHIIAPQGRLLRAWDLKGGISAEMTALEIALPGGSLQKVIARRPGRPQPIRSIESEYRLLRLIHAAGLPTQAPLYLSRAGDIFDAPCLVLEYIEGQPLFSLPHDEQSFLGQLAAQLAAVHSIATAAPQGVAPQGVAEEDFSFLPPGAQQVDELLARRPAVTNDSLDEGRIRGLLEAAWPLPAPRVPALLHGDYWPGNILWQGEKISALIDWEDAVIGDPLLDLAISRLDLRWIFSEQAMDTFTHLYLEHNPLNAAQLPYWDLYAALRLIRLAGADLSGWAAFFHPYDRTDITGQTIRAHLRAFIAQAEEKI